MGIYRKFLFLLIPFLLKFFGKTQFCIKPFSLTTTYNSRTINAENLDNSKQVIDYSFSSENDEYLYDAYLCQFHLVTSSRVLHAVSQYLTACLHGCML